MPSEQIEVIRKLPFIALCLLAIVAPTLLLWNADAGFYYDWHNHQWFVGYFGEYFRQHHWFPEAISSTPLVGMPQPVFYGFLFYPLLGLLAAFTGAAVALRIAVLAAFAIQFSAVFLAARNTRHPRAASFIVACTITWGIYSLTNLYNRAALTEFFAVAFLTAAVAFGVAAAFQPRGGRALLIWLTCGLAVLAAGAHPPTALLGGAFIALLVFASSVICVVHRRIPAGVVGPLLWAAAVGAVVLSPWVYANLRFRGDLRIVEKWHAFAFYPTRTDSLMGRLAPFPYDGESAIKGTAVSTPYAEAQISIPLLMLLCASAVSTCCTRRTASEPGASETRWVAGLAALWAVGALAVSLSPSVARALSFVAPYVQFPSRLVSHVILGCLVALLLLGRTRAPADPEPAHASRWVWAAAWCLALVGLAVKLVHGAAVQEIAAQPRYAWRGDRSALVEQGRMDGGFDYAAFRSFPVLPAVEAEKAGKVEFPVGVRGRSFGVPGSVQVGVQQPGWFITNTVAFRWADVLVDGAPLPAISKASSQERLSVWLTPGHHTLEWKWAPDPAWRVFRAASFFTGLAWLVVVMTLALLRLRLPPAISTKSGLASQPIPCSPRIDNDH